MAVELSPVPWCRVVACTAGSSEFWRVERIQSSTTTPSGMGLDKARKNQPPAAETMASAPPGVGPSSVVGVTTQPAGYRIA